MTIKKFLTDSDSFAGVNFKGNYTMSTDDFVKMFEYYNKTGINLLDDYTQMIYLNWVKYVSNYYYSRQQIEMFKNAQSRLRRSRLFDSEWLSECRLIIKEKSKLLHEFESRQANLPRKTACTHTSKKEIRDAVFEKYGKKCLCCGSTTNLTIDHVIPVSRGGENHINNYQPLCRSCNSRKNDKIIDYRKD